MKLLFIVLCIFFGNAIFSQDLINKDSLSTQEYVQGLLKNEKPVIIREKGKDYLLVTADFRNDDNELMAKLKVLENPIPNEDEACIVEIVGFEKLGGLRYVRIIYSDILKVDGKPPYFPDQNLYNSKQLVLIKPNGKERIINENWRIKIWTEENMSERGQYTITGPDELVVKQDTFKISEIQTIACATSKDRGLAGSSFIPGILTISFGAVLIGLGPQDALTAISIGIASFTPGILYITLGRKRSVDEGWKIEIR